MEKEENQNQPEAAKNNKAKFIKIGIYILAGLIVLGLAGSSLFFYLQYKKASVAPLPQDTRDEVTILTDDIKTFMELPNETPTLATVTDIEQARNQPFFAKALNGDKVLIYVNAKKAILYRPAEKKIIEVANVSGIGEEQDAVSSAAGQSQDGNQSQAENTVAGEETQKTEKLKVVKVAVYNGSTTKGLAATLAGKIDDLENVKITTKTNAKGSYEVTFVIDLTGENAAMAEKIAQAVDGQVGVFPEEEARPEADILVIGGGQ